MLEVRELNRLGELDSVRSTWRELLTATPGYSFFQTLDWLETAWSAYPHRQRLRVLLISRGGATVGIVPFCVRHERRALGPLRVLTFPFDDWGTFYSPLGADPQPTLQAAFRHVLATPRDWDVMELRWVDEKGGDFLALGGALRECGLPFRVRPRMRVHLCRLDDGWDAYRTSRSRNWRRRMAYDVNALERTGAVELVRHRPAVGEADYERDDRVFDVCSEIAEKSWQAHDSSQSTLCSPRVGALLRRLHHRAASLGMLDVNVLYVGGAPAAYNYNYVAEGRVYGLRCGYDPALELDGTGRVLLYKMLEDSFQRGDREYNFGPGDQHYKSRFSTETRYAYSFRHCARSSWRAQLMDLRDSVAARVWSEDRLVERGLVS